MHEPRDPLARLQELAALQQQTNTALLALVGGERRPSDEAYERYLSLARRLVAGVAAFEAESPGGFDVSSFAQPLEQQLSMYADYRQAAGDSEAANRLREEADAVTGEVPRRYRHRPGTPGPGDARGDRRSFPRRPERARPRPGRFRRGGDAPR
jgi:hypothetical protein